MDFYSMQALKKVCTIICWVLIHHSYIAIASSFIDYNWNHHPVVVLDKQQHPRCKMCEANQKQQYCTWVAIAIAVCKQKLGLISTS